MNWIFGTTPLDAFGRLTILEDFLDVPQKRGDNMTIPFRHGRVHVEKLYEQRSITFGLVIEAATRAALEDSLDTLKQMVASGVQTLTASYNNGSERTAQAEMVNPLGISRLSPFVARVTLDFLLADPFFYGTTLVSESVTVDASPKTLDVTHPGTMEARDPTIVLTGPLENTEITNPENGASIKYNAAIASPRVVTISKDSNGEYVATTDLGANVIGNVTHSGGAFLFSIEPGDNALSITDDVATTGQVGVSFYPPYL